MIALNGHVVNIGSFPDGTILMKEMAKVGEFHTITWRYENDREFLALIYLVKHLWSNCAERIWLNMPYIPNARQDRVKTNEDVFTLKYFAELLNSLNLSRITALDPHSTVSEALINNLHVETPKRYIERCFCPILKSKSFNWNTLPDKLTMFYPDEGAMKRYAGLVPLPYAFGIKNRDWTTGKIKSLDVSGEVDAIRGKDILIVDDICSRGGTFLNSAKKLKELGAKDIYLYVSHCENTILEGELLTSGLIEKVFTTNSIFTKEHEKIEVLT